MRSNGTEKALRGLGSSGLKLSTSLPIGLPSEVILRAAGRRVEPYWKIFTIHQKQEVYDILEK